MSDPPPPDPHPPNPAPTSPLRTLRIGTRSSTLAIAQVHLFATLLSTSPSPTLSTLPTSTHPLSTSLGDTNKTTPLQSLAASGKSLWTEDLEAELLANRVDVLVHSLKDVPTKLPVGCKVRALGGREERMRGDCVLLAERYRGKEVKNRGGEGEGKGKGKGLAGLPRGSIVGTSSVRRQAMVRRKFGGALAVRDVRGNVPTRIGKLDGFRRDGAGEGKEKEGGGGGGGYDAIILAAAGVKRLGLEERVDEYLDWESGFGHAVGQGALGVEWREGDEWVEGILREVEGMTGRRVRWEGEAERSLLRVLEGGCSVPVGVECTWEDDGEEGKGADEGWLMIKAMVVSVDGGTCVQGKRRQWVEDDQGAEECGWQMAKELVEKGAGEILKEIELNRAMLKDQDNA